jgi:TonB family protein
VQLIDFPDTIDLAFDETGLPDDGRHEPILPRPPHLAALVEQRRLDPKRLDFDPDQPPPERHFWRGPIGSLLLHLSPLLALILWPLTTVESPPPIPIQLVIEEPPPPPPPPPAPAAPKPPAKPPHGRLASDDFGQVTASNPAKGAETAPPTQGEPQPPAAEAQPAPAPAPVPPPLPPKQAEAGPPAAPPTETQTAAVTAPPPLPKPAPPKEAPPSVHLPKPFDGAWPLPLHAQQPSQGPHTAALIGPNATRDEYCAYALSLTMSHIDLLPLSFVGARRGDTSLTIRVLEDGTITSVKVAHGSGYADIDERIAKMVLAVGRFPPLPQWMPGRSADFTFHLHFPHPAER